MRFAVVGAGVIGKKHAAAVAAHEGSVLVAICDPVAERAALALRHAAAFYDRPEAMFEEAHPDVVIVATPTQTHLEITRLCAERGVHVLVEKPIAADRDEAREIVRLGNAHRVHVAVAHHRRHNPIVQTARDLVRGGALGTLLAVNGMWTLKKHDSYYNVEWRSQPGGGPVLINTIHDIDTLRFVCGEIESVFARSSSKQRGFAVEDTVSITLSFAGGALASMLVCDAAVAPWAWELTSGEAEDFPEHDESCTHFLGTEASLAFPRMDLWRYADPRKADWGHPLVSERQAVSRGKPLVAQIANLCAVARGQAEPVVSAREGARTLVCAEAIIDSARSGAPVTPDFSGLG